MGLSVDGRELPREARSSSELLAASHVFTIDVRQVTDKPWMPRPDGWQGRGLDLDIVVREVLKGTLSVAPDRPVRVEVFQRRSPSPFGEQAPLWSQIEPEAGASYLIIAAGEPDSPLGVLLNEGACLRILPGAASVQVHLARQAEQIFQETRAASPPPGQDSEVLASRALLAFTTAHLAEASDLFGRYLWARIVPSFVRSADRPVGELMALITSPAVAPDLRLELCASLDRVSGPLGSDETYLRTVANGYFRLLLDPGAEALHHRIVQVGLYLLVFPSEGGPARERASVVIPDPAARAQGAAALANHTGERAQALIAWLNEQ
jgi:hypothetical protein